MRLKLIQGDPAKKHKGLCHFSTFAKFSFMAERLEKRNWSIRETALRIALKLWWVVNDDDTGHNDDDAEDGDADDDCHFRDNENYDNDDSVKNDK